MKIILLALIIFYSFLLNLQGQNVGIGTNTPAYKLDIRGSVAQPLVNIQNNNASPFSYGLLSFSENGVGVFAQSLNGKALVGFTNSTTQPAAEFTNNAGAGVKITTNSATKAALEVINNGTNFLSYGILSFSQGGVGVFGQSNTGKAIVGFNTSATEPTVEFTNTIGPALRVNGGVSYKTKIVTADYTLTDNDHIIYCDLENNGAKKITVNLPTPNVAREGREFVINVLRAPIIDEIPDSRPGGFVQIIGTFGPPNVSGINGLTLQGITPNKLFYEGEDNIVSLSFIRRRTTYSYICINGNWYVNQDNFFSNYW